MKNLTLIIHANAQEDVADHLRNLDQVRGFTFSRVEGHGAHSEDDPFLSARDKVVGYTPRVRVDVLLDDADVEAVLATLSPKGSARTSQGIYWITTVEQSGPL